MVSGRRYEKKKLIYSVIFFLYHAIAFYLVLIGKVKRRLQSNKITLFPVKSFMYGVFQVLRSHCIKRLSLLELNKSATKLYLLGTSLFDKHYPFYYDCRIPKTLVPTVKKVLTTQILVNLRNFETERHTS